MSVDKFEIYPVMELTNLIKVWPNLEFGFYEILKHAKGKDDDIEWILQRLCQNTLSLWLVFSGKNLAGFFTGSIQQVRYKNTIKSAFIWEHAYETKILKPFTLTKFVFTYVENLAKQLNCSLIKTYSVRNVEKYYVRQGYTKTYTEYLKEVEEVK